MKYEFEYKTAEDREAFVYLVLKNHKMKKSSAIRRYYDLRKEFGELPVKKPKTFEAPEQPKDLGEYQSEVKSMPDRLKMFRLEDMKKYKYELSRDNLRRYGFSEFEINWLKDNGEEIKE